MSEQILNGTSAQLGYTVPFTLLYAEKTRQKTNQKTKHNPEKETKQNTAKPNYPGLVASYDTRPGNEMGLFYTKLPSQHGTSQQNRNDSLFVYIDKHC